MTEPRFQNAHLAEPFVPDPAVAAALDALGPADPPNLTLAYARQRRLQEQTGEPPHPTLSPVRGGEGNGRATFGSTRRALTTTAPAPAGADQIRLISTRRFAMRTPLTRTPFRAAAAIAVVLFGLSFLTSPMQSLANQFLTIFRVQDFAPVTITSMQGMPDLTRFGDMTTPQSTGFRHQTVDTVAAASNAVGFGVKAPTTLPNGLPTEPTTIAVTASDTVSFTFRAEKARTYLDSIGRSDFSLPAKFDGATLQVQIPAAALLTYGPAAAESDGMRTRRQAASDLAMNQIMVVQAKSPTVEASGVSLQELRDFMLSLPGLPPETAAQIRAIGDLGSTLPVPVPAGESARKIQVNGAPGVIFAEANSRISGGIVWQRDGIVYAAAGALNESELLTLAGSVR